MADVKISALPLATTPLAGTEVLPIVQSATTDQVSVANLTAGRAVSAASLTLTTTPLAVGSGGTGLNTLTAGYIPYGNGTSAFGSNSALTFDGTNLLFGSSSATNEFRLTGSSSASNGPYMTIYKGATRTQIIGPESVIVGGGSTSNDLMFYNAVTAAFKWNIGSSTPSMTLDASGNLLVGTSATINAERLAIWTVAGSGIKQAAIINNAHSYGTGVGAAASALTFTRSRNTSEYYPMAQIVSGNESESTSATGYLAFYTTSTTQQERMRILSGGGVCINTTAAIGLGGPRLSLAFNGSTQWLTNSNDTAGASGARHQTFYSNGNEVGSITTTTTATSYVTTSDYRLKEDISPMTGALVKVAQLKPVTYKWKLNGSDGEGFIAHELAEVCPNAVIGEKDAIDADGKIISQGIDTSFLVATLTAAIQELAAKVAELEAKI